MKIRVRLVASSCLEDIQWLFELMNSEKRSGKLERAQDRVYGV